MSDNNQNLELESKIFYLNLDKIVPNPFQPRITFDDSKLSALADSIKRYGVLQPIVVSKKRKDDDQSEYYEIIAGERRFKASKLAGLSQIPAIVKDKEPTDAEKFELAIIENIQREDLNPVDRAKAFLRLTEEFSLTHGKIAERMGKSREYVSNSIRILTLSDESLDALIRGDISEGHTRALLLLKERVFEQKELLQKIIQEKLTIRSAERLAKNVLEGQKRELSHKSSQGKNKAIETKLSETFGTKVQVNSSENGGGGKLIIEYFSDEDLEKFLALINPEDVVKQESFTNALQDSQQDEDLVLKEEKKEEETVVSEVVNNQEKDKVEETGGYDINFGAPPIPVKVEEKEEEEKEEIVLGDDKKNFDFLNQEINNFSVSSKEKKEEEFDNEYKEEPIVFEKQEVDELPQPQEIIKEERVEPEIVLDNRLENIEFSE
ncbi:MAG: ParB/RepB/Spo0J family partition protein, partial [Candidatus Pacebacteria bacterium]|nr:ParB/RepB/Spo0J family partition protein [Candidatus Paceibacterota bacterium]